MKKTYRIGEVGKLLGLSIDAIRFYEKKGLVHPTNNLNNHYREFNMTNILELLDIIYYRHLDISIGDIQDILKTGTKDKMRILLQNKRIATQQHILYEQQLVKKISFIENVAVNIEGQENHCSIRKFPDSYLLSRSDKAQDVMIHQLPKLSAEEFVLCSLIHKYSRCNMEMVESTLTLEKAIVEELNLTVEDSCICIPEQDCIYMVTQMKHMILQAEDLKAMYEYAKQHELRYGDTLYVKEVPLTSYEDTKNYYTEIFLPIIL